MRKIIFYSILLLSSHKISAQTKIDTPKLFIRDKVVFENNPLVIINGSVVRIKQTKKLPLKIKNIYYYSVADATALFGSSGQYGAIVIETNKFRKK